MARAPENFLWLSPEGISLGQDFQIVVGENNREK